MFRFALLLCRGYMFRHCYRRQPTAMYTHYTQQSEARILLLIEQSVIVCKSDTLPYVFEDPQSTGIHKLRTWQRAATANRKRL
jgi:hypothetical protein